MCVMDGGTLRGNYNYIAYDNSCIGCEILNITVQMYPCSEGTDTGSPALRYRESGTGIPHFLHASLLA